MEIEITRDDELKPTSFQQHHHQELGRESHSSSSSFLKARGTKFKKQINAIEITICPDYYYQDKLAARERKSSTSTPQCHSAVKYFVQCLLGLGAWKYQVTNENPFETRTLSVWCFLISTSVYCLLLGVMKLNLRMAKKSEILDGFALGFALLASVSLASVLTPLQLSLLVYILSGILFLMLFTSPLLKRVFVGIHMRIIKGQFGKSDHLEEARGAYVSQV